MIHPDRCSDPIQAAVRLTNHTHQSSMNHEIFNDFQCDVTDSQNSEERDFVIDSKIQDHSSQHRDRSLHRVSDNEERTTQSLSESQ